MKYIYKMSREMFWETAQDAWDSKMTIEEYITKTFGIIGECVKVEII